MEELGSWKLKRQKGDPLKSGLERQLGGPSRALLWRAQPKSESRFETLAQTRAQDSSSCHEQNQNRTQVSSAQLAAPDSPSVSSFQLPAPSSDSMSCARADSEGRVLVREFIRPKPADTEKTQLGFAPSAHELGVASNCELQLTVRGPQLSRSCSRFCLRFSFCSVCVCLCAYGARVRAQASESA